MDVRSREKGRKRPDVRRREGGMGRRKGNGGGLVGLRKWSAVQLRDRPQDKS